MTALSDEQVGMLLAEAEGTPVATPLLVLVTLGVRRGEALALTWGDVDLAEGRVSVRPTLEESSAGIGVKEPKTARDANVPKEGCVSGLLGRPFPRDPPAPTTSAVPHDAGPDVLRRDGDMATDSTFAWALKAPCIPDVAAVAVVPAQDVAELT